MTPIAALVLLGMVAGAILGVAVCPCLRLSVWLAFLMPFASSAAGSPHTGIVGQSFVPGLCTVFVGCADPTPVPTTIAILSEAGEMIEEIATDAEGRFAVHLKPGVYWLMPQVFTTWSSGPTVCLLGAEILQIAVEKKEVTPVEVRYASYCLD